METQPTQVKKQRPPGCTVGCAVMLGIVLLCGLGIPLLLGSLGQDHNGALAKWRAQNVQEYTITTKIIVFGPPGETLHVDVANNKLMLVDPKFNTLKDVSSDPRYRRDTVDGLFDQAIRCQDASSPLTFWSSMVGRGYAEVCRVEYDSKLGYPRHMGGQTEGTSAPSDSDWDLTVTELKILKQASTPTP